MLDDAHARCYRPFLHTLYRYPGVSLRRAFQRLAAGVSVRAAIRKTWQLLREMVERGQVEMFGGGDMEPVLAVIPARDRVGQINALSDRLARLTQQRPQGAWLTERVWEATLVPALGRCRHPLRDRGRLSLPVRRQERRGADRLLTPPKKTAARWICSRSPKHCAIAFRLRRRTKR